MKKLYIVLLLVSICGMAKAQGKLKGKITDGKEPIPYVNIVVVKGGKQINSCLSDLDGFYFINPIPPGKYDLKFSLAGYRTTIITGVEIKNDRITFWDIILKTGTLEQDTVIPCPKPLIHID